MLGITVSLYLTDHRQLAYIGGRRSEEGQSTLNVSSDKGKPGASQGHKASRPTWSVEPPEEGRTGGLSFFRV